MMVEETLSPFRSLAKGIFFFHKSFAMQAMLHFDAKGIYVLIPEDSLCKEEISFLNDIGWESNPNNPGQWSFTRNKMLEYYDDV